MASLTSITLKNFRHHQSLELTIPEGTIQFKGDSGSGKSSTAAAVSYGLFGKVPKTKTLATYGEKVFSVKLELSSNGKSYTIFRKNTPKTLKLKRDGAVIASNDKAEEILSRLIGVSYGQYVWGVTLRSGYSILEISPQEKYEAVCALAGVIKEDVSEKTAEINTAISSAEKRLSTLSIKKGRLEGIIKTLEIRRSKFEKEGVPDLVDQVEGVDEVDTLEEVELRLSEVEETLTNFGSSERSTLEKEVVSLETKLASLEELLAASEGYDAEFLRVARLANDLVKARSELQSTMKVVKEDGIKRKKEILAYYDEVLPKGVSPADYREWVAKLRERWRTYDQVTSEIEKISKDQKSAKEAMMKIFRRVAQTFPESASQAKTTKGVLQILASQKIKLSPKFCCPSCSATLVFSKETLVEVASGEEAGDDGGVPAKIDVDVIDRWVSELQRLQPMATRECPQPPTRPKTQLVKAEEVLADIEKMQGEIRSIDTGSSPLITRARAKLDKLEKAFKQEDDYGIDLEDMSDDLIAEYVSTTRERTLALHSRSQLNKTLEMAKKKLSSSESIESLMEEVSSLRFRKEALLEAQRQREETEKTNKIAQDYLDLVEQIKKESLELKKVGKETKSLEDSIIGLKGLKTKMKEAMLLSIEETIVGINEETKKYLEQLFDSGPSTGLQVSLGLSSKVEGKVVTRVVRPFSKGEETVFIEGKYEDLSDGERQRSRLAFFLGINAYLEPRLTLLIVDEALNQVEEARNTKSVGLIRDALGGEGTKIVISHESISGQFDQVIDF